MPRKPRVEFGGAVYHVMCRGDRQEPIYWDDGDRERFLETLWEASDRTGWLIHAYVLMGNHYHLLLETPEPNLVSGMRWFQGTYTARFNARHRVRGHLFQGRYKALPICPDEDGYFLQVSSYIHLNPVRARPVPPEGEALLLYRWSSYPEYLKPARRRMTPVVVDRVLGALGVGSDRAGRRCYAAHMDRLCAESLEPGGRARLEREWKEIRRGWYLGSEAFRNQLQDLVGGVLDGKRRKSFSGSEVVLHDEAAAEALVAVGLKVVGLADAKLGDLRKLDARKQVVAWWVRRKTVVKNEWLSDRLSMGDAGNVSKVVRAVDTATDRSIIAMRRRLEKAEIPKSGD